MVADCLEKFQTFKQLTVKEAEPNENPPFAGPTFQTDNHQLIPTTLFFFSFPPRKLQIHNITEGKMSRTSMK